MKIHSRWNFLAAGGVFLLIFAFLPLFTLQAQDTAAAGAGYASLVLNSAGDLEVQDASGKIVATLENGTIGQKVQVENQKLKISFGRDLKGQTTLIIYPDPESPQSLTLKCLGQEAKISSDSVLTVRTTTDLSGVEYQAGVLGSVSIAGQSLGKGQSVRMQNGSVIAPETVAAVQPPQARTTTETVVVATPGSPEAQQPIPEVPVSVNISPETGEYVGARSRVVTGEVYLAPPGTDPVSMMSSGHRPPALKSGDAIPEGSTLHTAPNSTAILTLFPGTAITVEPNTQVTFTNLQFRKSPPAGEAGKEAHMDLKTGGIVFRIEEKDRKNMDFQIRTPLAVAAARGTKGRVIHLNNTTIIFMNEHVVVAKSPIPNSGMEIVVEQGHKLVITRMMGAAEDAPKPEGMAGEERVALQNMIDNLADYLDSGLSSGLTVGERGQLEDLIKESISQYDLSDPRLDNDPTTPFGGSN
jgi:hypothetical protein